jgi:hypothetical protein
MLLRDPRLIIVTDRIRSPTTHTYRIQWKPATPVEVRNQSVPGFATKQIFVDPGQPSFKTRNPAIPNLSIYPFSALPLSVERATGVGALNEPYCAYTFQGQGEMTVVTVLYPRPTMEADVKQISSLKGAENTAGFKTELNDGTLVTYQAAAQAAPLNVGEVAGTASGLLWVRGSNGTEYGLALDCRALKLRDKNQPKLPASDFEFVISTSKRSFFSLSALGELASRGKSSALSYTPIYRPLALVEFLPKADVFTDKVEVAMSSATPDAEIRYTLDGTDPTDNSPLYNGPVTLASTCQVKARSFRKGVTKVPPTASGTEASAVTWAIYTRKAPFEPPKQEATLPGINFAYYEGDFSLSSPTIDIFKPVKTGVVKELFDFSARQTKNNYAFVYGGFIDIPQDGVYSFHAPMELIYPIMDAGYDLCVFLGREEWYPATRWHNYGAWSVPLKKGSYPFKVTYVDQRPGWEKWHYPEGRKKEWMWDGEKPALLISGPGLEKQPIPASMLKR